jgi:hypothetical protein
MSELIKLKSSSFSVLFLLVSMLGVNNTEASGKNITNFLGSDCYSVANYIDQNFSLFVEKYNDVASEKINASSVEKTFTIIIVDNECKKNGVFLDFDHDNGYAIVGDEYVFYDFAANGESPYKNIESDSFCFSTISGYLYLKNGVFINTKDEKNMDENCLDRFTFGTKTYAGQETNQTGCGHIYDTDQYIKDRYGSNWNLSNKKILEMATGQFTNQMRLSCYQDYSYKDNTLYVSSEGNCWFVSAYNVLQSLADASGTYKDKVKSYRKDASKPSMPSGTTIVNYDPKSNEYSLYKKVYDENGTNISGITKSSSGVTHYKTEIVNKSFPKLYTDVRKYVYNTFQRVDDGMVYDTANIINAIGKKYGYSFKAKGTVAAGLYGESGITAVNKGLPFILCTSKASNAGYEDHLMAGCGYKVYSKTSGWWVFKTTSYKYFYELRDGHSNAPTYFDLSAWTGFGGIVLLDYSLLSY